MAHAMHSIMETIDPSGSVDKLGLPPKNFFHGCGWEVLHTLFTGKKGRYLIITCKGHLSGLLLAYIPVGFAPTHLCLRSPLLVFKPIFSVYYRKISPSSSIMNLN